MRTLAAPLPARTKSLRATVAKVLATKLFYAVAMAAAFFGATTMFGVSVDLAPQQQPVPAIAEADPVANLLASNDCDLPAGVIPGHAVVTLPGGEPQVMDAKVGFAMWLGPDGVARTGDERPGTPHGFCR